MARIRTSEVVRLSDYTHPERSNPSSVAWLHAIIVGFGIGLFLLITACGSSATNGNTVVDSPKTSASPSGSGPATSLGSEQTSTNQEATAPVASTSSNLEGWQAYESLSLGSWRYPGHPELNTLAFVLTYDAFGQNTVTFLAEDATGDITTLPFTSTSVLEDWYEATESRLTSANIDDNEFKVGGTLTSWKKVSSNELVIRANIAYTDDSNTERTFTAPAEITLHKESWAFVFRDGSKDQYDWKISGFKWLE